MEKQNFNKEQALSKKTTVFISYNRVDGFKSGWHGKNNEVYICANDAGRGGITGDGRNPEKRAGSAMHNISGMYYNGAVPIEQVEKYYIYAGLLAFRQAINMAKTLRAYSKSSVTIVACDCEHWEKAKLLNGTGIPTIISSCGGEYEMGCLAKKILANE